MIKIFVFSISCVLFLSGCGARKRAEPRKAVAVKPANKNTDKDIVEIKATTVLGEEKTAAKTGLSLATTSEKKETSDASQSITPSFATSSTKKIEVPVQTETSPIAQNLIQTLQTSVEPEVEQKSKLPENKINDDSQQPLLVLSYNQSKNLSLTLSHYQSESSLKMITTPIVPQNINGDDLDLQIEGRFDKLTVTVKNKQDNLVQFQNIALLLSKETRLLLQPYKLYAVCVGSQCETAFLSVYKIEDKKIVENYPVILQWVDNQYKVARMMNQEEIQESLEKNPGIAQSENKEGSKVPPQMRVRYLLENNLKNHFSDMQNQLDKRMKKDNSIYSARFFYNLKPGTFDWILNQTEKGLELALKIEFNADEKKPALDFKGLIPAQGSRLIDQGGTTLDIYPVVKDEFYMMIFENQNFKSQLPHSEKAIQAHACQILVENKESYSECLPLASTYILGEFAQEGRIGGPILINIGPDGKAIIKDIYKPKTFDELSKISAE